MISILVKALTASMSRLIYAFFSEKVISKLVIDILKILAKKTSNTIDDTLIEDVASNMKI